MYKKHIYLAILAATLLGFWLFALNTHQVEAQLQTVYIRANGDVEPAGLPIYRNVDVYMFTGDIIVDGDATGMIIERDNVTLDGAGYSFSRFPSLAHPAGVELTGRSNVTIKNLEVKAFGDGIVLWNSSNNTIQGNDITANSNYGIALWNFSNYNTISGNNITANDDDGIGLDLSSYNSIHNNTVTGHYQDGIVLDAYSDHNIISRNKVTNNGYGIELYDSSNNTILQNNLTGNTNYGFLLYYSSYNNVSENNVTTSDVEGIFLSVSNHNLINGNHLENNGNGLTVGYDSNNNSIYENEITNNEYGIQVISSSNNTFCHNILVNNTYQVASSDSYNTWDCGYPLGGNYWSNYADRYPNATETDSSGIWDTPYVIDENNQDNYPLIPELSFLSLLLLVVALQLVVITYKLHPKLHVP
jgi:parallel beta-helix repeat protein